MSRLLSMPIQIILENPSCYNCERDSVYKEGINESIINYNNVRSKSNITQRRIIMNIEKAKDKIKKLLALSVDNPSDAEGYEALKKAQELMATYKLEGLEFKDVEDKKCIHRKTTISYGSSSSDHYLDDLAEIVASNFCCVNYISRLSGTRTNYICLMGMEDDVAIAEEVINTANHYIIRGYNKVYKTLCETYGMSYMPAKYFNPAKIGYIKGYLSGLKQALESQKEQNQEWGLVLVVPEEAQQYIDSLSSREFNDRNGVDNTYYSEGYNDGKSFSMNKKVEGSTPVGSLSN